MPLLLFRKKQNVKACFDKAINRVHEKLGGRLQACNAVQRSPSSGRRVDGRVVRHCCKSARSPDNLGDLWSIHTAKLHIQDVAVYAARRKRSWIQRF